MPPYQSKVRRRDKAISKVKWSVCFLLVGLFGLACAGVVVMREMSKMLDRLSGCGRSEILRIVDRGDFPISDKVAIKATLKRNGFFETAREGVFICRSGAGSQHDRTVEIIELDGSRLSVR